MPNLTTVITQNELTPTYNKLILGTKQDILQSTVLPLDLNIPTQLWRFAVEQLKQSNELQLILEQKKVVFRILPHRHSRHNSPSNADAIRQTCKRICTNGNWDILICGQTEHIEGQVCAVAKAFPLFSAKTSPNRTQSIHILSYENGIQNVHSNFQPLLDNVRLCGSLIDQPPSHCHISDITQLIETWAQEHPKVHYNVIRGTELTDHGLNGIWNVGKAAIEPPAMITLQWKPENSNDKQQHVCWVGKGIIYDTGGLSLKTKTGMPGMKMDMGGAAAVLTAFKAAVEQGCDYPLSAVLCMAENAIGPQSVRPDDIITMYSGKTVEINNTDAEGRLVLGDGVAWAEQQIKADVIIDIATLTGAASTSVGKGVAAIYTNDENLERLAVKVGRQIGELCHPLPYIPEKWKLEFQSSVADMKNSVARRNNAQSACAGQFIGNHLSQRTPWLHLDIAGAAYENGRGTGFGTHLLIAISNILQ